MLGFAFNSFRLMVGRIRRGLAASGAFIALTVCCIGQTYGGYSDLHDFGQGNDGAQPEAGLTFDKAGNMYGTTFYGGANGWGNVWEVTAAGAYRDLYDFPPSNGVGGPVGGVAVDAAGNLYGTTSAGINNYGCVWKLTASGNFQKLHIFTDQPDGREPITGVTFDAKGNMYGTTLLGGDSQGGTVWEIKASGVYVILHSFGDQTDGRGPSSGVTVDGSGNLFGTASWGGANLAGLVWEITASGAYKDILDFQGLSGGADPGPITVDAKGNIFGTTGSGGDSRKGVAWELTISGAFKILHSFGDGTDGADPLPGLTIDAAGNIFGTTVEGGANGNGTVWEITASGSYSILHDFGAGSDGNWILGGVTIDGVGNLYGTARSGGAIGSGYGMVWRLNLLSAEASVKSLSISPHAVLGGTSAVGTVTLTGVAPSGGAQVALASSNSGASVAARVIVPGGSSSTTFSIATVGVQSSETATITAIGGQGSQSANLMVLGAAVTRLSINPVTIAGGSTVTGTVTISGPAASGGTLVQVSSNNSSAVPVNALVPAGQTMGTFTISTKSVGTSTVATLTAALNGTSKTATLTVTPPSLATISVIPSSFPGGASSTCKIDILGVAGANGFSVSLKSSSGLVTLPSGALVLPGQGSISISISSNGVRTPTIVTITATGGGVSKSVSITLLPFRLSGVSVTPTEVSGGSTAKGTVSLLGVAPAGGVTVQLTTDSKSATVPSKVFIPAGSSAASFDVATIPVAKVASVRITARIGNVFKIAYLLVDPH